MGIRISESASLRREVFSLLTILTHEIVLHYVQIELRHTVIRNDPLVKRQIVEAASIAKYMVKLLPNKAVLLIIHIILI